MNVDSSDENILRYTQIFHHISFCFIYRGCTRVRVTMHDIIDILINFMWRFIVKIDDVILTTLSIRRKKNMTQKKTCICNVNKIDSLLFLSLLKIRLFANLNISCFECVKSQCQNPRNKISARVCCI